MHQNFSNIPTGLMDRADYDVAVLSSPNNVYYASGLDPFPRPNFLDSPNTGYFVILGKEKRTLLVPGIEAPYVESLRLKNVEIEYYGPAFGKTRRFNEDGRVFARKTAVESLADLLLGGRQPKTIAMELDVVPESFLHQLRRKLRGTRFINISPLLETIRQIKTPEEVRVIRQAVKINETALSHVIRLIGEGTDVSELHKIYHVSTARAGAHVGLCSIGAGKRLGSIPVPRESRYSLRTGDLVRLDLCPIWSRYWSDLARTAVVGSPSRNQAQIYSAFQKAQLAALSAISPGKNAGTVYKASYRVLKDEGLPCPEFLGHGIGLALHESPSITLQNSAVLSPNMVLSIEQYYFNPRIGGLQIEDNILVTSDGFERLSGMSSELIQK